MKTHALILAAPLALVACQQSDGVGEATPQAPGNTSESAAYDGITASETVRFTGTEPFWGGSVSGTGLTYTTPENIDGSRIAVTRFAGRGGVSWSGELDGKPFRLAVSEAECSDGMSDRTYPFTATLDVRGERRSGCAWTDRRPYDPSPEDIAQRTPREPDLAARDLVLAEWRKGENRNTCAPATFTAGAERGTARRANFGGGWAVAWDLPGQRSAFGISGTGLLASDDAGVKDQRARLAAQWPYFKDLPNLPNPAFAGYGVEGAGDYPAADPQGRSVKSLAYVRIGGQKCDYNVWSSLGRAHLEELLDGMQMIRS